MTFGNVSSEFHFGKEMCIMWWGGGAYGVRAPLFDLFDFLFSDKIKQIGVLHLKNFHFSLVIFKNGVKTEYKPYFG